ncbi:DUF1415 domain-containing protein [Pseudomonadales bacterium]|nr:DUF1415 domain-containing protein [Pseudomonadales bacterium]
MPKPLKNEDIVTAVQRWVSEMVVGLNLCPFAKREWVGQRIRFVTTDAQTPEQLLDALQAELARLDHDPSVETTVLIHPQVLTDFFDYNEFLGAADELLVQTQYEGIYQIASFHPNYQFAGTDVDDAENFTNRSPYPLLHLLREDSLAQAIVDYPDASEIPARNIALMNQMGRAQLAALLLACTAWDE